jgi:hypothetical protein
MSCDIIQFSQFTAAKEAKETAADPCLPDTFAQYRAERLAKRAKRMAVLETAPETLTVTCRNKRLREQRKIPWGKAEVTTRYWRARMDWRDALTSAQTARIKEAQGT